LRHTKKVGVAYWRQSMSVEVLLRCDLLLPEKE
jgi:hypothetical protein